MSRVLTYAARMRVRVLEPSRIHVTRPMHGRCSMQRLPRDKKCRKDEGTRYAKGCALRSDLVHEQPI